MKKVLLTQVALAALAAGVVTESISTEAAEQQKYISPCKRMPYGCPGELGYAWWCLARYKVQGLEICCTKWVCAQPGFLPLRRLR
jgi:hypothetical protein